MLFMAKPKRKFEVIDPQDVDLQKKKTFSKHDIISLKPLTQPQEQFFTSYFNDVPLILQLGSSGTGKSMCALYCALNDILDRGTVYEKIIIIRSAVQSRDMGFTSGDADQKAELYESPYIAIFDEILKYQSNNYLNLKAKNLVEFHTTSFLRGSTFNDSIIIADEVQSMNFHELSTLITRTGHNSRLILCGDTKQNDLIKKKGDESGLPKLLRVIEKMDSSYTDVVN